MSEQPSSSGDLILRCPVCTARFGVTPEGRGPHNVHVDCPSCGHVFTTEEMLAAMGEGLNDLIALARAKLAGLKLQDEKNRGP